MPTKPNKIIETHLYGDSPTTGVREIFIKVGSVCKCFIIPKDDFGKLNEKQSDFLNSDCLYFLVGSAKLGPYVGRADNGYKRIQNHKRNKGKKAIVWDDAIAFVSRNRDESLGSDYTHRFEYLVTNKTKFRNTRNQNDQLPKERRGRGEVDRGNADEIFPEIQELMSFLGYDFLEWDTGTDSRVKPTPTPPQPAPSDTPAESSDSDIRVYCSHKCDAQGIYNADKGTTVVKAGSRAAKETSDSYKKWHGSKREDLLEKHATYDGEYYVVSEDLEFVSPSAASDFCTGMPTSGLVYWKDRSGPGGKTLGDIIGRKPKK